MTAPVSSEDSRSSAEKTAEGQADERAAAVGRGESADADEAETLEGRNRGRYKIEKAAAEQAHQFRWHAARFVFVLAAIPAVLVTLLGVSVFFGHPDIFVKFVNNGVGPWPIGVFITGVFVSFIAVFGFLAKGAFGHSPLKDDGFVRFARSIAPIFDRKDGGKKD